MENDAWLNVLPETIVIGCETEERDVVFSYSSQYQEVSWECHCDDGTVLSGIAPLTEIMPLEAKTIDGTTYSQYRLRLASIPMGYQELTLTINDESFHCHLISIHPLSKQLSELKKNVPFQ